jgi:hypothetical protein
MYVTSSSPLTIIVIGKPTVLHAPIVHQSITRAAVKANDISVGMEHAQVGDTADIEYAYGLVGLRKYTLVEYRNQWRTLSARGDVTASKICHNRDACAFR